MAVEVAVARRRRAARMERRSARGPALPSALWTAGVRARLNGASVAGANTRGLKISNWLGRPDAYCRPEKFSSDGGSS